MFLVFNKKSGYILMFECQESIVNNVKLRLHHVLYMVCLMGGVLLGFIDALSVCPEQDFGLSCKLFFAG
ncbi:hypothetical protein NS29R_08320 [Enterobacter hormaechei subsp. xiangfangensis]|uniref:hypothetical protein n=1 Tax=Enterobacter hormaechei TaxID=158836 RepID=UPI0007367C18|nr:hypothetical protein [Enterobacter hormaechei]HAV1934588.1 hypothetical protein [Enterobacter hormaechei subsp. steigerwaltii]KTQ62837.1 hypothetical protein NS34R_14020 [Enterobacter hormaechei]KTQ64328.1 hypothetical protein NS28R_02830 [Enterobacter hormaechei subsp. xiangfangensis]KTQ70379.1 hypothetical protein NS19R_08655 [Enterobacter hormaechei subsp. xiangfangensis]KTQ83252.1 hypothetical protein NS7_01960 [Enterobacter hormaechei]